MKLELKFIIGVVGILTACGFTDAPSLDTPPEEQDNNWMLGPFLRPEGVNPVISPLPTEFYCPMRREQVKWEESDTFNPAATVKERKNCGALSCGRQLCSRYRQKNFTYWLCRKQRWH